MTIWRSGLWGAAGALVLGAAGALAADTISGAWSVVAVDGKAASGPTLAVQDSRVSGNGGCNRYSGPADMAAGKARFGPLVATRMACENLPVEQAYFAAMEKVRGYRLDGDGALLLTDDANRILIKLMR